MAGCCGHRNGSHGRHGCFEWVTVDGRAEPCLCLQPAADEDETPLPPTEAESAHVCAECKWDLGKRNEYDPWLDENHDLRRVHKWCAETWLGRVGAKLKARR